MVREGYIKKIIWEAPDSDYCVLAVETTEGDEVFVGDLSGVYEGMFIQADGEYVHHHQYDLQFKVLTYSISMPTDLEGIESYLGSGMIKGVGTVIAGRIVSKFKTDTLRIMAEEPERLAEVRGISMKKAREIGEAFLENYEFQDVVIRLSRFGISPSMAMKIYRVYGKKCFDLIQENPYRLAEDISGIGFKRADAIAANMGIAPDSGYRLQSALLFALSEAQESGHIYLPEEELKTSVYELLKSEENWESFSEKIHDLLVELSMERKVILKVMDPAGNPEEPGYVAVYSFRNYKNEEDSARRLMDLRLSYGVTEEELAETMEIVERNMSVTLDPVQKEAVRAAICSGVAVITGGPGTGKTTIISAIIHYFEHKSMTVELAAPTGRAAKRITESTGVEARTIHRLLEFVGEPDAESRRKTYFARNEENPLECDAVIIDEASMMDAFLFHSLLQALNQGTRLILVGDVDQLPSVGAGNVLHDVIASGCFPVTTLSTIFRQAQESQIIQNAHKIRNGKHISTDNDKSGDFFFIDAKGKDSITGTISGLLMERLPKYLKVTPEEIQVLTPMRKGNLGANALNLYLQQVMNPPSPKKREYKNGDVTFREGDKVMQIRNNYQQEWQIPPQAANGYLKEEGVGVFNGDMGRITLINSFDQVVEIAFDDGREATYAFSQLDELEHAFAMTIHKSQGSEYPAVVMPVYYVPGNFLSRNLFYTAVTRAKSLVVLVGDLSMVNRMIDNVNEQRRYTSLNLRLEEIYDMERNA